MYIWENNNICIFSSLDSDCADWPLVADTNGSLFFFVRLSSWTMCPKIIGFTKFCMLVFCKLFSLISQDIICSHLNRLLWIINIEKVSKLLNFFWQITSMLYEFFLKSRWIFAVIVLWMLISLKNSQVFKFQNSFCHFGAANLPTSKLVFVFSLCHLNKNGKE